MSKSNITIHCASEENLEQKITTKLFAHDNIQVIGIGPPSCLRILYFQAQRAKRLGQLQLYPMSRKEYATMSYKHKVEAMIHTAASIPGTKGIILYVSCGEIIAQVDFEPLIAEMESNYNLPVCLFKRGPMESRKSLPSKRLERIFNRILQSGEPKKEQVHPLNPLTPLPPLASDYTGALTMYNHLGNQTFLLTPGGCAGTIGTHDQVFENPDFLFTRFNDLGATMGIERQLETAVNAAKSEGLPLPEVLIGTPVSSMLSVDFTLISRTTGIPDFQKTNGFSSAITGGLDALLKYVKTLPRPHAPKERMINILGYNPLTMGRRTLFDEIEQILLHAGVSLRGLRRSEPITSNASMNWVISSEGIEAATYMQKIYEIPFFADVPIGVCGIRRCLKTIGQTFDFSCNYEKVTPERQRLERILIIAEPLTALAVLRCMKEDIGYEQVTAACYAPLLAEEAMYKAMYAKQPLQLYTTIEPIKEQLASTDILVADPLYQNCIDASSKSCKSVALPYPIISGNLYLHTENELFGKGGVNYFQKEINTCIMTKEKEH